MRKANKVEKVDVGPVGAVEKVKGGLVTQFVDGAVRVRGVGASVDAKDFVMLVVTAAKGGGVVVKAVDQMRVSCGVKAYVAVADAIGKYGFNVDVSSELEWFEVVVTFLPTSPVCKCGHIGFRVIGGSGDVWTVQCNECKTPYSFVR